jgi:hypothetical protein
MAAPLYPPSTLDSGQVLQHAYDENTQSLRVNTEATVTVGDFNVAIDHADDSIKVGDGTDILEINSDGSVNVRAIPSGTYEVQPASPTPWVVDSRRGITLMFSAIDIASSGDNIVIAADPTKKIKILAYSFVVESAVSVQFKSGGTNLSGAMPFLANGGISSPTGTAGGWIMETAVNNAFIINLNGAIGVRGHVSYFLEV